MARRTADGTLLRLESVQNPSEQGKSAAAALLGQDRPFTATPWFWSDRYDKKLQMAGLSSGADLWIERDSMDSGSFSSCHFMQGSLIAVDSINAAKDHLQARKLLDSGAARCPDKEVTAREAILNATAARVDVGAALSGAILRSFEVALIAR